MSFFDVINLAGGIALFLYGMSIMGSGLERIAGGKMEGVLQKLTSSTFRAVLLGAGITALIQSSAGTTVIVIGLVNSGIMQLTQAIGVIMGANIGTTVTGQILRLSEISGGGFVMQLLKPATLAPIVAFIGAILFVFIKKPKQRNIGQIMLGFGILFTGMFKMEAAVQPLQQSEVFRTLFTSLQNPLLGILAGALVTVAIQSSSASVGILMALSSTGVVTWGSAIPIILGQNIGTCSTPLLASIGASKGAKRSAIVHLYFNIIGATVFMAVIYGIKYTIGIPFWNEVMNMGDIANFHTAFNIIVTVGFLPFTKLLARLAERTIPDSKDSDNATPAMPILDERLLKSPSVAIQQARGAVETMAQFASQNYARAVPLLFRHDPEEIAQIQGVESMIDKLQVSIGNYLVMVTDRELSDTESHAVSELLNYVTEFERIGDYAVNVVERSGEIYDKEIIFSEKAKAELQVLDKALCEIIRLSFEAFRDQSLASAERVEPLEETIDTLCDQLRSTHIDRLKKGLCGIENGVVFLEVLTNLERISDHCSNIAAAVIGAESEDAHFDAHELRRNLHNGVVPNYNELLSQYKNKYVSLLAAAQAD